MQKSLPKKKILQYIIYINQNFLFSTSIFYHINNSMSSVFTINAKKSENFTSFFMQHYQMVSEQVYSTLTKKFHNRNIIFYKKKYNIKKYLTTFSKHKIKKSPTPKCGGLELVAWLEHVTCSLRMNCSTNWAIPANRLIISQFF